MALTQFSGSLSWRQLCGLAAALCDDVISLRVRSSFRPDLIYQPNHLERWWTTDAEATAHAIPYSRGGFVCHGYAEGPSTFFRWAMPGGKQVRAKKMSGGLWALEYEGPTDTDWHRLVRDACSEPCEPAATAVARSARG